MKKKKKSFITTVVPRLQNSGAVWDDRMDFQLVMLFYQFKD